MKMSPSKTGYAKVNGLSLYYEIHGTGDSLILLHGGLGSMGMFGPVLSKLAEHRQGIAVGLQAHGRTADIDRPLSFDSVADDSGAWSKDLAKIEAPTMLVFGDADAVQTAHAVEFFRLLGGGQRDGGWDGSGISNARLAILPGLTHYNIFSSPVLASTVESFLDDTGG